MSDLVSGMPVAGDPRPRRQAETEACLRVAQHEGLDAEREVAKLYERGTVPPVKPEMQVIDEGAITARYAGQRYLASRTGASLDPIELDTLEHYRSLIEQTLLPCCDTKRITLIQDFENRDLCTRFTESWRQMRRKVGEVLAMSTRRTELQRFRTFLKFCVENGWMPRAALTVSKPGRRPPRRRRSVTGLS